MDDTVRARVTTTVRHEHEHAYRWGDLKMAEALTDENPRLVWAWSARGRRHPRPSPRSGVGWNFAGDSESISPLQEVAQDGPARHAGSTHYRAGGRVLVRNPTSPCSRTRTPAVRHGRCTTRTSPGDYRDRLHPPSVVVAVQRAWLQERSARSPVATTVAASATGAERRAPWRGEWRLAQRLSEGRSYSIDDDTFTTTAQSRGHSARPSAGSDHVVGQCHGQLCRTRP